MSNRQPQLRKELLEAFIGSAPVAFFGATLVGVWSRPQIQHAIGGSFGSFAVGLGITVVVAGIGGLLKAGAVRAAAVTAILWCAIGLGLVLLLDKGG